MAAVNVCVNTSSALRPHGYRAVWCQQHKKEKKFQKRLLMIKKILSAHHHLCQNTSDVTATLSERCMCRLTVITLSFANNSVQLISRDKLEVQCRYCFQTETQTSPAGPLTFKAGEPGSGEDAGSLLCLCLLLLFDYWAKLFNQVWNHKKATVLTAPGQRLF